MAASDAVSNLADAGRYSAGAILSCAAFLVTPEPYTIRIRERAELVGNSEVRRDVAITAFLPPAPFGLAAGDEPAEDIVDDADEHDDSGPDEIPEAELFPFPYLSPKKGQLLTVHQLKSGSARPTHLSHGEHEAIAKLMLAELLYVVGTVWLYLDYDAARPALRHLREELSRIPEQSPERAQQTIDKHFTRLGLLKAWRFSLRSDHEPHLFALCKILAQTNLVIAETVAFANEPFELTYSAFTRFGHDEVDNSTLRWRERIALSIGSQPHNLRLWTPLAALTSDYHFYMQAPEGYYFTRQLAYSYIDGQTTDTVQSLPKLVHERSGITAQYQSRPGAVTEAHIHVVNGDKSQAGATVDIGLSLNEIPLGSSWPAFIAAASTSMLMGLLLLAKFLGHGQLGNANVPALLIAFVSNSITLASSLFGGRPVRPAATSRLVLLACAIIGNAFAVWWLFNQSAPHERNIFLRLTKIYGGYVLFAAAVVVLLIIARRLRTVVRIHDRVARDRGVELNVSVV